MLAYVTNSTNKNIVVHGNLAGKISNTLSVPHLELWVLFVSLQLPLPINILFTAFIVLVENVLNFLLDILKTSCHI